MAKSLGRSIASIVAEQEAELNALTMAEFVNVTMQSNSCSKLPSKPWQANNRATIPNVLTPNVLIVNFTILSPELLGT